MRESRETILAFLAELETTLRQNPTMQQEAQRLQAGLSFLRSYLHGPLPQADREALGQLVRRVWIAWAQEQPVPKASWLTPWEDLSEPDREVDRRIGEIVAQVAANDHL